MPKDKKERKPNLCTEQCFHTGRLYEPGEVVHFAPDELPVNAKGQIRHFKATKAAPDVRSNDEVAELRAQIEKLEKRVAGPLDDKKSAGRDKK